MRKRKTKCCLKVLFWDEKAKPNKRFNFPKFYVYYVHVYKKKVKSKVG